MRFVFDHDLHIHSQLSACSDDPAQNPQRILDYARENGLTTLCLTDHYWDAAVPGASRWYKPQDFDHISQAKPLPQGKTPASSSAAKRIWTNFSPWASPGSGLMISTL